MTLAELGESGLIAELSALGLAQPEGVIRGIGDDAAVFRISPGHVSVISTDLLIERVHFRLDWCSPEQLGRKALAVNLSDLAAMGARPRQAFIGFAGPGSTSVDVVRGFFHGFVAEGRKFEVNLLGGDLSRSAADLVISVTVVGEAIEGQVGYRSGAEVGDVVLVTGHVGDAACGLHLLERGLANTDAQCELIRRHHEPTARLAEGAWLATHGAHAMVDLSDGILSDLRHVLSASGDLGATLDTTGLPLSAEFNEVCAALALDPVHLALTGGEDYELLVTAAPDRVADIRHEFIRAHGLGLTPIGRIEADRGVRLHGAGRVLTVADEGHRHWR